LTRLGLDRTSPESVPLFSGDFAERATDSEGPQELAQARRAARWTAAV